MEKNTKETKPNKIKIHFENKNSFPENFSSGRVVSSSIHFEQKKSPEISEIQRNSNIAKTAANSALAANFKQAKKPLQKEGEKMSRAEKIEKFEFSKNLSEFGKILLEKGNSLRLFIVDHFFLLFQSTRKNYERINGQNIESGTQETRLDSQKQPLVDARQAKYDKQGFDSFNNLERYQKKVRKITFSLSSVVAVVLVVALVVPYFFSSNSAEASAFIFSQSSWAGGATANTATHPTNKTSWTEYASKDDDVVAVNDGADLQLAPITGTDNINFNTSSDYTQQDSTNGTTIENAAELKHVALDPTITQRTLPASASWTSVTYGNGVFVAVASGGTVAATSPDGITWTQRTLPASASWTSVTHGNGVFVAVAGNNSTIAATSSDGITWTQRTLPASTYWSSVTYGNGTFVAVAGTAMAPTSIAATSPDGITWTQQTLPASNSWSSVTYGNGVFMAITTSWGFSCSSVGATSPDGITWTQRATGCGQWSSVTFGNGSFVMVSSGSGGGTTNVASTSPDGITWTARTLPASAYWSSVTYGSGLFAAVASGGTVAATSPDGITWTSKTLPASASWSSITYGNGTFVVVASGGTVAATITSFSPPTITQQTLPASTTWASVAYGNGMFATVASGGTVAATSPDGITWTQRTLPASATWASVAYGNGVFVAVASGGTVAATSPDGITWTQRTLPASVGWSSITYGNSTFVAVASGGTVAATSPDGITWTQQTLPANTYWKSVGYGNGVFVAVAGSILNATSIAATSPDGITWTQRSLPTSTYWMSVTYGNGVFVAVNATNIGATSPDGITWTQRSLPASTIWFSVAYGNGVFVAVDSSTRAITSADGITWTQRTLPSSKNWNCVAYGNGMFVSVAGSSSIAATITMAFPTASSYYITTTDSSQIDTTSYGQITGATITQSTPTNTSIKYLASFDDRSTWKYFDGDTWETTTLSNANLQSYGMTNTTIQNLSQSQWEASGGFIQGSTTTLDFAADLKTTDATVSPSLDNIEINYSIFSSSATLTSSAYDSNNSSNIIDNITWTEDLPANTDVQFQIQTAPDNAGSPGAWSGWMGPDGTDGTYFTDPNGGESMPSAFTSGGDDQWFQYKAFLSTTSASATPTLSDVTVQYNYNVAPAISSVTYTQNANGTVTVPYTLTETYDDLGNIAHGTAAAPIKVLLFWQPDSAVTAPVLTDSQTGIITLANTNSQPIPTSGSMLIDTELITFDSAGCTGNQRNILTRGATFDTDFPTTATAHSEGAAVFFNSSSAVQTVNTFSATGTPGDDVSTSGSSFVWDPRNDSNSNLNTNKLTGLLLKVVANDADVTNFNTIGQSSVTAAQTLDLQLPTFTVQYYSDAGLTSSLGDNPKLKAGTYYIKISASEALASAPTISIDAEGTANDVTNAVATLVSGNDYRYTRTIASDAAAVGTVLENISITGTDSFSNVSTNVNPTDESIKAGYTDTTAPTFTMQYYSDSGLTNSLGTNPKLKAGTYYVKISASEALVSAPTISIAAEGTANDVTDAATTLVSGNDYTYTRVVASDASAVGTVIENFSVTGTDNASNASTNVNPTDEATKAGYTDTVSPTSPGAATLNSYLNNTGNQTVSWTEVSEASFQDYLVQRKAGVGGTFATIGTPITNIATTSYADNSNLAEGTYYYQVIAEDTAGNTTTGATSEVLTVDKTAPILQSFTSSSANSDPDDPLTMYGTSDTINMQAVFDEDLADGSTMTIELENTAGSQVVLNQVSGTTLSGTYTVSGPHDGISDDSIDLAVRRVVSMSVSDPATNVKSSESVPTGQNLSDNKDIIVDTVPPSLQSFSATAGNYNAGDSITLVAHYNKSVKAGSNIHVKVNSDGGTATIDMTSVSTSTISGPYVVQSGDNVQNLKVASIVSQAVSDIKNNQLTDTIMPSTNISDGVLVDTTAPVITFTDDVDSGPTQSDDVTINVSEINPASHKYIFSSDNVCNTKNYTSATSFGSDTPITFIAETNNDRYICTKSVDTAGNESYAASANPLNIDITDPTGTILINRSATSGQIQLTAADGSRGIAGLQMRSVVYDDDTTSCDLSGATWEDFAATLDLVSDSDLVKACVEYRDVAGNTTIISSAPPQTPQSFQYYDVSDPEDFRVFLSWKIPTGHEGSKGFYQYQIFQCLDAKDNADCTINTAGAPDITLSQESTNYKNYLGLSDENKYCYQVRFASHDADGTDYSEFSDKKCVIPSSGGSSVTKDLAILFPADPVPDAEVFANQVTIHWDTVNANDNSELLPADSQVCWRVHLPDPPGWNCRSYESYETSHAVTISKATNQIYDLVPDTEYEYQVHSETSWGKEATMDGPATFTTKNGPVIKNINADPIGNSTATVRWTTENKAGDDLASSSSLWYALAIDSNDNLVTPTEAACDSTDVINHTCTLSDLSIGTQYYYYVESTANSATARDTANGAYYRFTTLSDSTPPVITANPGNPLITTDTQAAISWETNERATSWLLYDTANHAAFDNFTDTDFDPTIVLRNPYASYLSGNSSNLAHNFIMSLNSLEPNTDYYYRLVSQDTSENVSVSQEYSFTTLPIQTDHPDLTNPGNPLVAEHSDIEAVIYLPAANTDSTSKICWDTDVIADMDNCANYLEINTATKSHFYHVTGLTPETVYHVMTKITDSETASINFTSEDVTFTTEKIQIDQHEPLSEIADVASPPSVITDTKAVITFNTDQVAKCSIEYGTETGNYSEVPFVESGFNVNHSIHMTGLIFSTAYFYQIACIDDLGNTEDSDEYTFTTLDKQLGEGEYNALQDATAPEISSVKVDSVTGETAVIIWNTDEEASSSVGFGIESGKLDKMAGNYLTNMDKENYSKTHTVTISGLIPSTKYYYKASSLDASGNIGESSEGSFTTSEPSSLSSVKVESNKMGEATITWTTGNKATSIVEYGLTTSYGDKKEKTDYVEEHSIELSGLNQGETYHYRVKGEDEDGNLYASSDNTFEPKSPPKIENIVVSDVTENGAVVSFTTDVLTDANVIYTDADNSTETGSQGTQELSTKHKITLTNLKQGTTYRISVSAKDEFGSESRMEAKDFTTGKDENPPNIESVHTDSALTQSDKVQTIISWKTNEQATSVVIFREGRGGSEVDYKNTDSLSTNHVVVMPALKAGTVYNFRVKSADAAGNESVSQYFSFLTPRTKENIIQIIINNFTEIFGWTGNVGVKK